MVHDDLTQRGREGKTWLRDTHGAEAEVKNQNPGEPTIATATREDWTMIDENWAGGLIWKSRLVLSTGEHGTWLSLTRGMA
ncbi:hypothetical protein CLCR_00747 [Cladophialophora carrionii]|uniref:Uncharacterized protein n=1 Tax=Cladophialophora carrionii TaxID=86049 RepID=A0A1C1C6W2_9EURO|nr:hypothetical protein CLCR_00747 [Cladophialophora carrionii]